MQRCGLCSLLSRLLRRAMCVGSRRGSGESYYQELAETTAPEINAMETDRSIYISLIPTKSQQRRVSDSDKDRPLLEALMIDDKLEYPRRRHACTGRFLTMHKRRRKKLTTRALLQDTAILDDILHGQVQCILNQVGNWRFNAFTLETVTGGRSLPVLCVHLFHYYGLLEHFKLDVVRLWKLFTLIEEGYHSTNPYHNSIHATDVTQAMHCFLQESKIYQYLEPVEIMASLIGAVTHDLDHPGVNQPFLIATSNHLAALYENTSVLENHHWRSAVGCLLESGVAEQIQHIRPQLENQISSLILATDITRQQEFLNKFKDYLDNDTLDMKIAEHRHFILQIALKCADISNPCRPWDISKKWSQKVCEEFFRQGDYERQLNLPVTSVCDRYSMSVPKIQVGFFKFVVTPLFDEWQRFLSSKLSRRMMYFLKYNQIQWENRVAAEVAEETRTEISEADLLEEEDEDIEDNDNKTIAANDDHDNENDKNAINKQKSLESINNRKNSLNNKFQTSIQEFNNNNNNTDLHGNIIDDETFIDISDSSEILLPKVKLPRRSSLQVPNIGSSRFDRRHSVPVNPVPRIILTTKDATTARISHEAIREDMENRLENDSFSILSSDSDSFARGCLAGIHHRHSSADNNVPERERPLSAETLVHDLSIATMSNSACADRLNLVMHGAVSLGNTNTLSNQALSKQLIRQQTFPPLQPYIRARYMSATTEMGTCQESLVESSNSTSSSGDGHSPATDHHEHRGILMSSSKKESIKRSEQDKTNQSEKSSKIAKLSMFTGQKENLDPSVLKKNLNRRRGSAPVTMSLPLKSTIMTTLTTTSGGGVCGTTVTTSCSTTTTKLEDTLSLVFKTCDKFMRRGSMPVDVIRMGSNNNNNNNETNQQQMDYVNISVFQRRGSVPCDNVSSILQRNNCNGKSSRTSRKKLLRRRSSGGAEILSPILAESESIDSSCSATTGNSSWQRFKRELSRNRSDMDSLLNKRRGSLPVEVLAVCHSGSSLRH